MPWGIITLLVAIILKNVNYFREILNHVVGIGMRKRAGMTSNVKASEGLNQRENRPAKEGKRGSLRVV